MSGLPRFVSRVVIASSLLVPSALGAVAFAQETAPATAPAADAELRQAVENFWHYGRIARYDLAAAEGQKVLAKKDKPLAVLEAFEATVEQHRNPMTGKADELDEWMLRWQGTDQPHDVANQITAVLNEGRRARRADPKFIDENVKRLLRPGRPYLIAVRWLRDSGEFAVPIMMDYLRDPNRNQYHDSIRKALVDIGRPALNPLLATTEMKSQDTLISVIGVIGDIGYNVSVPYLARLANSGDQPQSVRAAATAALMHMGISDRS